MCLEKGKIINRNNKKELELDIEFIDGMLEYCNQQDYESVERCLRDWKNELLTFKQDKFKKE